MVDRLVRVAEPALVTSTGPRYFGYVIGGALDAATCADLLAVGWDQNGFQRRHLPGGAVAEEVAGDWLKDLLGLPPPASFGLVTGGQGANTVGAGGRPPPGAGAGRMGRRRARSRRRAGRAGTGQRGAPRHHRCVAARCSAWAGRPWSKWTPTPRERSRGRARAGARRRARPARPSCVPRPATSTPGPATTWPRRRDLAPARAWVHVDGAFGLWAAASPTTRHLVAGVGARRLVGRRRPQVAQRPLRLRLRLLRRPRRPCRVHVLHRRLPDRPRHRRRSGRRATLSPSRRGGRGASPPGRRCASWAGRCSRAGRAVLRPRPLLRRAAGATLPV